MEDEIKKTDETSGEALENKEAESQKESKKKTKAVEPEMTVEEYMNEKVPFEAIWDGERYKDDINVTVNGKTWQIQRGKLVFIPRFVYEAIVSANRQKGVATATSMAAERRFEDLANSKIL